MQILTYSLKIFAYYNHPYRSVPRPFEPSWSVAKTVQFSHYSSLCNHPVVLFVAAHSLPYYIFLPGWFASCRFLELRADERQVCLPSDSPAAERALESVRFLWRGFCLNLRV